MKSIEILIAEYLFCDSQENAIKFVKENEFDSCLEQANHILQMVHLDIFKKRFGSYD